jgi:hypothetical protein
MKHVKKFHNFSLNEGRAMRKNTIVTTPEMPIMIFGTDFENFMRSLRGYDILMNIIEWAPPGDNYAAYVTFTGQHDALIEFAMEEFELSSEREAEKYLFG